MSIAFVYLGYSVEKVPAALMVLALWTPSAVVKETNILFNPCSNSHGSV